MQTHQTAGDARAAISTGLVRLYSQFGGKGPTKAKTYFVRDTVVCILRGPYTTVEQTLIGSGRGRDVEDARRAFKSVTEERFKAVVEEALGRRVIAYISLVHQNPDLAVETFFLEPADDIDEEATPPQEALQPRTDLR